MQVIGILLGVFLCGGASLCLGMVFLRRFLFLAGRVEGFALAFVVGCACYSQAVFFLCAARLAGKEAFVAVGVLAAMAAIRSLRAAVKYRQYTALPGRWKWPAIVL